ncbi:MAG: hypothetical protein ACLGH8_02245 [Bacteroidia bacterium]
MMAGDLNSQARLKYLIDELVQTVTNDVEQKLLKEAKPMEKEERIMSAHEVCSHFKISQTTLERRIRAGLKYSQAVKKGNRLFKLSDCEDFFNIN